MHIAEIVTERGREREGSAYCRNRNGRRGFRIQGCAMSEVYAVDPSTWTCVILHNAVKDKERRIK